MVTSGKNGENGESIKLDAHSGEESVGAGEGNDRAKAHGYEQNRSHEGVDHVAREGF